MLHFSVIVAFYKGNQYIPALVRIVSQNRETFRKAGIEASIELILVNDSPGYAVDETALRGCTDVKLIGHDVNSGIHQARVTGLQNCGGEFIVFLDQDDLLSDDALYREYLAIGGNDAVIANAWIEKEDHSRHLLYQSKKQFNNTLIPLSYIVSHNQIKSPGQCLLRKSAIPEAWCVNIMHQNGADDFYLWLLMHAQNKRFVLLEKAVYTHGYTGSNMSCDFRKMTSSISEMEAYISRDSSVPADMKRWLKRCLRHRIAVTEGSLPKKLLSIFRNADTYFLRAFYKSMMFFGRY